MYHNPIGILFFWLALTCQSASQQRPPAVSADPPTCDCCVFDERAPTQWKTRLAPDTAAGTPLQLTGTVYESNGHTPARNVLMYFYHTNALGRYAKLGTEDRTSHAWWHGYCRGWLKTNNQGQYQINTIKPGAYPNETIPAHIHFWVKAPSQRTCYYLNDFVFANDPFLTESYWSQIEEKEGFVRYEGVSLSERRDTLVGQRDIYLLPQYDRKATQSGLRIGTNCPAFDPKHVWGPDRGKRTCPMCAYGSGRGVMIWTRSMTSDSIQKMAQFWENQLRVNHSNPLKVFVIYTNPDRQPADQVQPKLEEFARRNQLRNVAVLYVPSPTDKGTAFLYNINPLAVTTLLFYKRRTVIRNTVDPSASLSELIKQRRWLD